MDAPSFFLLILLKNGDEEEEEENLFPAYSPVLLPVSLREETPHVAGGNIPSLSLFLLISIVAVTRTHICGWETIRHPSSAFEGARDSSVNILRDDCIILSEQSL